MTATPLLNATPSRDLTIGLLGGLGAQAIWGFVIVYFKAVAHIPPVQVIAHRAIWALPLIAGLLLLTRGGPRLKVLLARRRAMLFVPVSAILLGVNWLGFVYCVVSGQILQSALAYFSTPLMMAGLGVLVLGERLRGLQKLGLVVAGGGVLVLTYAAGTFPWLGLGIGAAWSLYSLIRRANQIPAVEGLVLELTLLAVAAMTFLAMTGFLPQPTPIGNTRTGDLLLLMLGGVLTAAPLTFFGLAARRLTLTTLGFIQYLGPTIQFVLAVAYYGEPFGGTKALAYGLIWAALVVFTLDSRAATLRRRREVAGATPVAAAASV